MFRQDGQPCANNTVSTHALFLPAHQLTLLFCRHIALVESASAMIYSANYIMDRVSQSVVGHLPLLILSLPGSATSQPVCYTTNNVVGDIQGHCGTRNNTFVPCSQA